MADDLQRRYDVLQERYNDLENRFLSLRRDRLTALDAKTQSDIKVLELEMTIRQMENERELMHSRSMTTPDGGVSLDSSKDYGEKLDSESVQPSVVTASSSKVQLDKTLPYYNMKAQSPYKFGPKSAQVKKPQPKSTAPTIYIDLTQEQVPKTKKRSCYVDVPVIRGITKGALTPLVSPRYKKRKFAVHTDEDNDFSTSHHPKKVVFSNESEQSNYKERSKNMLLPESDKVVMVASTKSKSFPMLPMEPYSSRPIDRRKRNGLVDALQSSFALPTRPPVSAIGKKVVTRLVTSDERPKPSYGKAQEHTLPRSSQSEMQPPVNPQLPNQIPYQGNDFSRRTFRKNVATENASSDVILLQVEHDVGYFQTESSSIDLQMETNLVYPQRELSPLSLISSHEDEQSILKTSATTLPTNDEILCIPVTSAVPSVKSKHTPFVVSDSGRVYLRALNSKKAKKYATKDPSNIADIMASLGSLDFLDLSPLPCTVKRVAMRSHCGGSGQQLFQWTDTDRCLVYPNLKQHPHLPKRPGMPGVMDSERMDNLIQSSPLSVFVNLAESQWTYMGEYTFRIGGTIDFGEQREEVLLSWAHTLLDSKQQSFMKKHARMLLRKRKKGVSEKAVIELMKQLTEDVDKVKGKTLEVMDVINALWKGDEVVEYLTMHCESYDNVFAKELCQMMQSDEVVSE